VNFRGILTPGGTGWLPLARLCSNSLIAVELVEGEDGKFYVDAATTEAGSIIHEWTEGPFDTEAKARDSLRWQFAMPVIEKL
jgi:hypothetical protein